MSRSRASTIRAARLGDPATGQLPEWCDVVGQPGLPDELPTFVWSRYFDPATGRTVAAWPPPREGKTGA